MDVARPAAQRLSPLGLTSGEEAAYELLVRQPFATQAELAAGWTGSDDISAVLGSLERRRLVNVAAGPPARYSPVAPSAALRGVLLDYERRLTIARQYRAGLDQSYQAHAAGPSTPSLVEIVRGEQAAQQRLGEILGGARREIRCLTRAPNPDNCAAEAALTDRGVTCRTIYDQACLKQPGTLSAVEELIQSGHQARVLPDLTMQLYVVDLQVALLPQQDNPVTQTVTIVHPSALFDALIKLFEAMWQRAVSLHPPNGRPGSSRRTPAYDRQRLITLLLSGLTDAAIARQLGRSHRSVQRRVAQLMADLGAHTRFQAGAQAAVRPEPKPHSLRGR